MQIREEIVEVNLGEAFSFLHISDIHIWFSDKKLRWLEQYIKEQEYDLIVLTGDYYDLPYGAQLFFNFLSRVSKSTKVVFIRGNHDFYYGKKLANQILEIPNCICVENRVYHHRLTSGKSLAFTSWDGRNLLKKETSAANILLVHKPGDIDTSEIEGVDLILAGHLHGGQIVLYRTKKNYSFPACLFYKYCTDRTILNPAQTNKTFTSLIVNNGMGDTLPIRFNCPHEVVKIILQ